MAEPARVEVVGLGPAGPELVTDETRALLEASPSPFVRTARHPAVAAFRGLRSFDHLYESAERFDDVYEQIVSELLAEARRRAHDPTGRAVVYAVPGSPTVAERTVVLLRDHPDVVSGDVDVTVHPALSFVDLAFTRLRVDPVAAGVRLVDGAFFATGAAGERGPLLVAQCWSPSVLSAVKLSVEATPDTPVTILHHLGLDDEVVVEVPWEDLDRTLVPDHLTSLWVPTLAAPVAAELVQLDELVRTLRARCPWDRAQTHGSLARHLMEESYEVLEAIDAVAAVDAVDAVHPTAGAGSAHPTAGAGSAHDGRMDGPPAEEEDEEERAVAHLEEELGDLLFQVYFHAALAAEAGRFSLADVARGVHDKLVSRHPHVFGEVPAESPDQVAANWEMLKKAEKNRKSVTEGIPRALPSLALATKLQRKGLSVGMELPGLAEELRHLARAVARLPHGEDELPEGDRQAVLGEVLFSAASVARLLGLDAEQALRSTLPAFRASVEALG